MTAASVAKRLLVAVTTVGMVVGNALIGARGLFGRTTAEVSARYPVMVTPAGYVFAIWGLIYVALLTYCVAQFLKPLRSSRLPDRLAWPLVLSNIVNLLWLVAWHALFISLTALLMATLLVSLVQAYLRAHGPWANISSRYEYWTVRVPISLYLAWISVATISNIAIALYAGGWRGGPVPEVWWAAALLLIGAGIAAGALVRNQDAVFALVFVWAFVGIAVEQESAVVVWTSSLLAGILAAAVAYRLARSLFPRGRRLGSATPSA